MVTTPSVAKPAEKIAEARTTNTEDAAEKTAEAVKLDPKTVVAKAGEQSTQLKNEQSDHTDTLRTASGIALAEGASDTLIKEQEDHLRTLAEAAGLTTREVDEEVLQAAAKENAARIAANSLQKLPMSDDFYEAVPANWILEPEGDTDVKATNRITGRVWEGAASDFGSAISKPVAE